MVFSITRLEILRLLAQAPTLPTIPESLDTRAGEDADPPSLCPKVQQANL